MKMTQINFTLDFEKLKEELVKSGLNEVSKSMLVIILNDYMERERDEYMENKPYDRSSNRHDYRNGYYERDYFLTIGKVKLKVPRTRYENFKTDVFEKYERSDQALLLSMAEMVVNGVSTRKVTNITKQLYGETVSKSLVSELAEKLDPVVKQWANRNLGVQHYRYLYVDATYIKVREENKVVSKAVYIGLGVKEDGKREIVGLKVGQEESENNWKDFFDYLKARGFKSPRLIISDAHPGLVNAIQKKFIGTSWQRCTVHFKRNIFDTMPKKDFYEAKELVKAIFEAPSLKISRELKDKFISDYEHNKKYQQAIKILDEGYEDAIQFYAEPIEAHKHIKTTNVIERLNEEVKRRTDVIRIFPHEQSAFRLIGSVLKQNEERMDLGNKRYIHFKE